MIRDRGDRSRAPAVGRLLRSYRLDSEHGGGRLSQDGLLNLMAELDSRYADRYDRTVVSHWERGTRLVPREFLVDFGEALGLTEGEVEGLLVLAGYDPLHSNSDNGERGSPAKPDSDVETLREQVNDLLNSHSMVSGSNDPLRIILSSLQKALIPGAYIGIVGYTLNFLGLDGTKILLMFAALASGLVLGHGILRWRRSDQVSELFFVSVFFLLNAPIMQCTITEMDIFGYYAIPAITGTPIPFMLSMATNLVLAVVATIIFDISWNRQYGPRGAGSAAARAAWISFPPLLFVYGNILIFANAGAWIYFVIVLGILFGCFWGIITLRDGSVRLSEWEARFTLQAVVGMIMLLSVFGVVGLIVNYLEPNMVTAADHNMVWSWETDFSALGYPESEYFDRLRVGLLWMSLSTIGFLSLVVGGYLLVTVHRYAIQPTKARQT